MKYQDFDVWIIKENERYRVKTVSTANGKSLGEAKGVLSLDPNRISAGLKALTGGKVDSAFLKSFGGYLHENLFRDQIRDLYQQSIGRANSKKGVRIRLRIDPPEISALPWELLYDLGQDCFLATSVAIPLTRYIDLTRAVRDLKTKPPIKVLLVVPANSGLNVEKEKSVIVAELRKLTERIPIELRVLDGAVTVDLIDRELTKERSYHILHFIGHGSFCNDEAALMINSEKAENELISANSFALYFQDYPSLKLIVLNSCKGAAVSSTEPLRGMAPQLVRKGIPAVIAMQYAITDEDAITFAKGFYLALCGSDMAGRVDAAVSHARRRICQTSDATVGFATPVLFMRSEKGIIFDFGRKRVMANSPEVATDDAKAQPALGGASAIPLWQDVLVTLENNLAARRKTKKASEKGGQVIAEKKKENLVTEQQEIEKEKAAVAEVEDRIWPWYKTLTVAVTLSVLLIFASSVKFFNVLFLDNWIEKKLISYASAHGGGVQKPDHDKEVATVLLDYEGLTPGLRGKS